MDCRSLPARRVTVSLLLALLLVACELPATPSAAVPATASPRPAGPTLPAPTLTPTGTPTSPAPAATSDAVPPRDLAGVIAALPALLARYAADLDALRAHLAGWGALETEADPVRRGDLDGDGHDEVLLLLCPPGQGASIDNPRVRALVLLQPVGSGYDLSDMRLLEPALRPDIVALRDLTGDGTPEALVTYEDCGAHTCFLYVTVLACEGGRLRDLLPEPAGMSYAELTVEDRDGDGSHELVLHGGAIGSVGAGPVQTRSDVYAWDGRSYGLAGTTYDPSPVRVHVLYDGDRALRRGDLAAALAAYRRVATDPSLADEGFAGPAEVRHTLEAFARYRLVTVQAALGDREAASQSLNVLRSRYRDHPCAQLAQVFWDAWEPGPDVAAGCAAAAAYAAAHPEVLEAFGDYGYANPPYTLADICFLQ